MKLASNLLGAVAKATQLSHELHEFTRIYLRQNEVLQQIFVATSVIYGSFLLMPALSL